MTSTSSFIEPASWVGRSGDIGPADPTPRERQNLRRLGKSRRVARVARDLLSTAQRECSTACRFSATYFGCGCNPGL
jgi:hypothetical protein